MVPSADAGLERKRNWSLTPQMSPPPPCTVQMPLTTFWPPAGVAPPMSLQPQPTGHRPGGAGAPAVTAIPSMVTCALLVWLYESAPQPASRVPGMEKDTVEPDTGVQVTPSGDVYAV